jgi:predicted SAM-dependent methyltransferase
MLRTTYALSRCRLQFNAGLIYHRSHIAPRHSGAEPSPAHRFKRRKSLQMFNIFKVSRDRAFTPTTDRNLKLHLGCGPIKLPGWVNIDIDSREADLNMDLRAALPFANGQVDFIFSEHFIEHITRDEGLVLLRECRRVLSDNGTIRISTPDLHYMTERYLAKDITAWHGLWHPLTPCQMMNEGMRSWGHQFVYDWPELQDLLASAGFHRIIQAPYRSSEKPVLCYLEQRPFHNEIIAEAVKLR